MKIERYTAQSTVSELEAGKQALYSPKEAASYAGLGWKAASDIAGTTAKTIEIEQQAQTEMEVANDKVQSAIDDGYYESALKQAKEEHAKRAAEGDPTWSPKLYAENIKAINSARIDAANNLQNPMMRKQTSKIAKGLANVVVQEAMLDAVEMNATRAYNSWSSTFVQAVGDENYEFAQHLLNTAVDVSNGSTPLIGPIKEKELRVDLESKIKKKAIEEKATKESDVVMDEYLYNGMEGGDAAYEKLLRNKSLDPEVKKKALQQSSVNRANFVRSQQDEKDRESAEVIRNKTIYGSEAEKGQFNFAANDMALEGGKYGEDTKSASALAAWAEVYKKIDSFNKKQVGVLDVSNAVKTGKILEPNKANRLLLDAYMEQQVEALGIDVDSAAYFMLAANTAQSTGTLPHREMLGLNGGYVSKEQAQKYYPLWKYLKDNDELKPDLGLTPEANTMYSAMESLEVYGTPPEIATEVIWNARDLKPADKDALILDYEEQASSKDAFKDLVNSDFFEDADKYFTLGPETETKMAMRYAEVRKAVYMATNGNIAAATDAADKAIKATWGPSNFGNADPSDYTIQENPLGKDMSTFQDIIISNINSLKVEGYEDKPASEAGVTFNVYTDDGYQQVKALDKNAVSFQEIPQLEENRRDGVRRYQVLHNGRPVINMDTGRVLDFPISKSDARNITRISDMKKARADEVERIQDRITEIESEKAKEQNVQSPYVDLQALEAELAGLKRALPNAKTRSDETKYSVYPMYPGSQEPQVMN